MANKIAVSSSTVVGAVAAEVAHHLYQLRMKAPMLYQMLADVDAGAGSVGAGIEAADDVVGVETGKGADLLYWSDAVRAKVESMSLQDCTKVYQGEVL
jgi:hypothetical protein